MTKSELFKTAWTIARKAAGTFGGSAKSYFSESLKQAWATAKKGEKTMEYKWDIQGEKLATFKNKGVLAHMIESLCKRAERAARSSRDGQKEHSIELKNRMAEYQHRLDTLMAA